MDAVRMVLRCEQPFDVSKLVYLHCIDLPSKKFASVTSFACVEVCYVLGHFSFPSELAVRGLCCVLWSKVCNHKLAVIRNPVLLNVTSSCYFTDHNGRNITFILDFDVVGRSGISTLPRPNSMQQLENSSEDDPFADCCPWLDLSVCRCNCTEYPKLLQVVLPDCSAYNVEHSKSDSASFSPVFDESEDEENVAIAEVIEDFQEDNLEDHSEFSDERDGDKNLPLFTEYVGLRGSSFHADCQSTLKKCREILAGKGEVELRLEPEPENIKDCNAITVQAKVNSQWDRIGYIPKEKVPKFTSAMNNNEIKEAKFKIIKCQYIMIDSPKWTYVASVIVTKTGRWLPNNGHYKYNDKL